MFPIQTILGGYDPATHDRREVERQIEGLIKKELDSIDALRLVSPDFETHRNLRERESHVKWLYQHICLQADKRPWGWDRIAKQHPKKVTYMAVKKAVEKLALEIELTLPNLSNTKAP